jgi:hypothetical protein
MMSTMRSSACLMALMLVAGCKKESTPATPPGSATPVSTAALQQIGLVDPFAKLSPDAQKASARALKAQKAKSFAEARREWEAAITLAPDRTSFRYAALVAAAQMSDFASIAPMCEAIAARDLVAYGPRLSTDKRLVAFRGSAEWKACEAMLGRYREAWSRGFDKGFFFVAREAAAVEPKLEGAQNEAPLELAQEVFFYDVDGKRYRRMSDTGGHAFALHRNGNHLSVLIAPRLHRENEVDSFVDPKVAVIDLATLETVGPFVEKGRYDQVVLATSPTGQPLFTFTVSTGASATYTIDTARTGLAHLEGIVPAAGETRAWPNQVAHLDASSPPGVRITDGANQFVIELGAGAQPISVTAARPIAQSSIDWSPGHQKLTYAGRLDACRILKSGTAEKNEIYVYDLAKKAAQRVAAAVSQFETLWLDDDRLVYEGGVGKDGQIHLYTFSAHADTVLPTRHGAGLYGVPTLACEQAESGVDEDLGEGALDEGD